MSVLTSLFKRRTSHRVAEGATQLASSMGAFAFFNYGVPLAIKTLVNHFLKRLPGYRASIGSFNFSLKEGVITLNGLQVSKKVTRETWRPFLAVSRITISFGWADLMQGICESVLIEHPSVLIDGNVWQPHGPPQPEAERREASKTDGRTFLMKTPIKINRLVIQKGEIAVVQMPGQSPGEDVSLSDLHVTVRNLTNRRSLSRPPFVTVDCKALLLSSGRVEAHLQADLLAEPPTASAAIQINDVQLADLRNFFKRHLKIDVSQGQLEIFCEMALKQGIVQGYAKPIIDHLHIQSIEHENWAAKLKANVINGIAKLLKNKAADRIATRINFKGTLQKPSIDVLTAIGNFLRNAFSSAIKARFDPRVHEFTYGAESTQEKGWPAVFKESFSRWKQHEAMRMAASLSYYTVFSLAPLLLLVIAIAGLVFGREAAEGGIVNQIRGLVGSQSAEWVQSMIAAAWKPSKGLWAAGVSLVSVMVGAFGVLSELKHSLNRIMQAQELEGLGEIIKQRAKYLGFVLALGFLLLVSLAMSALLSAVGKWIGNVLPFPEIILQGLDLVLSLGMTSILFALIFKYLPDRKLPWRPIWAGSVGTAVFFTIGKSALGLYLGKGAVGSSYGAAGSVLIVLLWVYYSALILYGGVEVTKVYSERRV